MSFAFRLRPSFLPVVSQTLKMGVAEKKVSFPVRRIYCVGQNYESHAREMGALTPPVAGGNADPFFFSKPADCLVTDESQYLSCDANVVARYPSMTESYHHEVELVVAIGPPAVASQQTEGGEEGGEQQDDATHNSNSAAEGGVSSGTGDASAAAAAAVEEHRYHNIPVEKVRDIVYGYAIGLDMTRRDLQMMAKKSGRPWDLAKGADDAAIVSAVIRSEDLRRRSPQLFTRAVSGGGGGAAVEDAPVLSRGAIYLRVNDHTRQAGDISSMITGVEELVATLSQYVSLAPGDLIFTGTPSGVGPVRRGDLMQAGIEGIGEMAVSFV